MELFGYTIGKTKKQELRDQERIPAFSPPPTEDGAMEVAPGGSYGTYVDLEGTAKTEAELVTRYRDMALTPEADSAIDDIVNEAIIMDDKDPAVTLDLDAVKISETLKQKIRDEFEIIIKLLDFNNKAYDIFRRWYVDGRIYYHKMIDIKNPRAGIQELRYIDPRKIRRVREPIIEKQQSTGVNIIKGYKEYFLYNPRGLVNNTQGLRIAKNTITHGTSGITDKKNSMVLSHLHKAVKPLNQLRMLEDASVIYRLSRAPERRIFYIDVGNLPKLKAEQYLRDMMTKHKNKLVYDASTGEVRDDRKFMTMLEDFWLPRREGGRGTQIETLPGGQNLGEIEDIEYFQKKLYKALNVPISRLDSESQFNMGRTSEITRDEMKFTKFIHRLRKRFSMSVFDDMLETQLRLKNIIKKEEWDEIKSDLYYDYKNDNQFSELKDAEIMKERLSVLADIDNYTGKYFSEQWIKENVLRMTEKEIKDMEKQIQADEKKNAEDEEQASNGQDASNGAAPDPNEVPPGDGHQVVHIHPPEKKEQLSHDDQLLLENMNSILQKISGSNE